MSLNLGLQHSAQKDQVDTIDLEVKGIEAEESRELLSTIQVGFIFFFSIIFFKQFFFPSHISPNCAPGRTQTRRTATFSSAKWRTRRT